MQFKRMKITQDVFEELKTLRRSMLKDGIEYPNPTPVAIPAGVDAEPMSLQERIQRVVREQVSAQADQQGFETFEEANDFDVDEDQEMPISSIYDVVDMAEEPPPPSALETTPSAPVSPDPSPNEKDDNDGPEAPVQEEVSE